MFGGEESEHLEVAPTREPVISIRFLSGGSILASSPVSQKVSVLPGPAERPGGWGAGPTARVRECERAIEPLAYIFLAGTLKYYPLVYGGSVLLTVHSSPANFQLCVLCLLLLRSWWILIEIEIVVVVVFLSRLCLKSIFKNLHSVSSFLFTLPPSSTLASIHQKWK